MSMRHQPCLHSGAPALPVEEGSPHTPTAHPSTRRQQGGGPTESKRTSTVVIPPCCPGHSSPGPSAGVPPARLLEDPYGPCCGGLGGSRSEHDPLGVHAGRGPCGEAQGPSCCCARPPWGATVQAHSRTQRVTQNKSLNKITLQPDALCICKEPPALRLRLIRGGGCF